MAKQLGELLLGAPVATFSMDDFHHPREHRYRQGEDSAQGYYEDAFDCAAIVDSLLKPLSGDSFPALCRPASLDLTTNLPSNLPPLLVAANAVVLFEGIFALRRELDLYWDFRILVDVDAATSVARAVARDAGSPEEVERKYRLRYEPAWSLYVEREHPEARADVVIGQSALSRV